jgi:uncharacterized protein (DUF2147 family)
VAVNHFAEAAGLDEGARANLVAAFDDAFHEVFGNPAKNSNPVQMSIAAPGGKIEAVLLFRGDHAKAEKGEKIRSLLAGKLDSVSLESSGDTICLKLVKKLSPPRKKR